MAWDLKMNVRKHAIASFFEWDKLDRTVGGTQQALGILMEDVWITPSIGEVPQWLEDSHVRDGICALLKRDRCEEEQIWLSIEADNLCRFFGDELAALELALCLPERGQVNKSLDIAATLSGAPLNASHHTINASTLAVPDYEGKDELSIDPDHSPAINSEQAAVADVLEGQMSALELEDDDSTAYGHKTNAIICWNLLVDDFSPPLCIPPHDCAILLWHSQLDASGVQCAMLSTHDLPAFATMHWTMLSGATRHGFIIGKRTFGCFQFIGHWALGTGLGDRQPWENDVKDIMRLIARFLLIARQHEHCVTIDLEGWVAQPLNVECLQNNNFDCSIWVLATILVVVWGRHITGMREQDMDNLWHYLRTMVLSLPNYCYESRVG
ncbi:hypothetical protein EV424DRAFT_1340758 [Suillus variegatus]|nr:hypothetical protein EV424DRAFT_1340758 [Suillus variegatus]